MPLTDPDKAEVKVIVHEAINGRELATKEHCQRKDANITLK